MAAAGCLRDNLDDVLAVEVARLAQERLDSVVVVAGVVLEVPRDAAERRERVLVSLHPHVVDVAEGPARERAGGLLHVVLRVVAHAHREELQQLAAVVLVDRAVVIVVVVEPEDHRGVAGELQQEVLEAAEPHPAEHLELVQDRARVVGLGVGRGEEAVPEERHLLLQGAARVDHTVEPLRRRALRALVQGAVKPADHVLGYHLRVDGVEKLLDRGLVPLRRIPLQLVPRGAEPGPAHQVRHQRNVIFHRFPPGAIRLDYSANRYAVLLRQSLCGTAPPMATP